MNLAGKRVFVSGADGFIGSHLTELLVLRGARVRAMSQYNSFNSWGWLEDSESLNDIEIVSGDIRDSFFIKKQTRDIDIIFHLAALIAIPFSYVAPESYVETNVSGTLNILEAARENDIQKVLHTSTSEVYGTAKYVPIDENHPLQPQSPYSATKISADALAESYHRSFNLPVTIVRPFNTYGPRQSARAIIPTVITQILSGAKELELGSLHPTRDFNYVTDTCRGFLVLAECDEAMGRTINIGSNTEVSIGKLVRHIAEIMDAKIEIKTDEKRLRPEKSEVERLWCDNSLIRKLTEYSPEVNLYEGLGQTVQWFSDKENIRKYKLNIYNV